ncbi:Protein kinase of the Mitotic Exit Network [Coemansia sp. RSA 564]|nr:Protein kinase of the Mitotic Exit Network [Coemansia sp. RSA 564]
MGDERRIGEYQLGDIIGKGAAGSVYRGLNLRTGAVVAIKQIRKEGFSSSAEIEAARKEIDVLRDLHHQNIVKYIGYEQTEHELDIILEYCEGGSLQNILSKFSKFPENLVGVYVSQILDGLSYLHRNAILHRDIKPGNILLLKDGVVKLADFGVARIQNGLNTVVGSPYWIAPEVLLLHGSTSAADIWSLGCTIVQLVSGKAPYQDLPPMTAMFRIGQDEHPPFPPNISAALRDFLSRCLVHVPSARATADELSTHVWIRACLRERQGEGQTNGNYERDIRTVAHWNQVLLNSSPRDVKRFSIGAAPGHTGHSNLHSSYSTARAREDIPGAISGMTSMGITHIGEGVASMGISNSNESTARRTVSSIAAYEEDSGDDWDNAFQNLDALQLKPKSRPGFVYPQTLAGPTSPRKHSVGATDDLGDGVHGAMPGPVERTVSDPAAAHASIRAHTSPPSPRLRARRSHYAQTESVPAEHVLEGEDETTSSGELVEPMDERLAMAYYASASDVRLESMGEVRLDSMSEVLARRPVLGLRQDPAAMAALATTAAPTEQISSVAKQAKAKPRDLPHGFPSRASEERLRRETELRWVQDIATTMAQLRAATQDDVVVFQCQQLVALLREGRGVFSVSSDWRVRAVVDALRAHSGGSGGSGAAKHLLMLANRLCHMDARFARVFCLHGMLPVVLPIVQRAHSSDVLAEAVNFVGRLCRADDAAPVQMLLACGGVEALCAAAAALVEQNVSLAAAAQLSRVITALISLLISKAMPAADMPAADLGDMLAQARMVPVLVRLFTRYGAACHPPSPQGTNGVDVPDAAERVYHGVCDVLMVASRLFNELVRRVDALQDAVCESGLVAAAFQHVGRYPRKAVVLVVHGVRHLSKNPASLDVLERAGFFAVSEALLRAPSSQAYREYVMATVLRLCSSSLSRQITMATQHPFLVSAAMECAQVKEAPTLSKCGRLLILGLASAGPQCCRVLKDVCAFELIVKLISRERWCGMAIRALLEWARAVPAEIVPALTDSAAAAGWAELARPLLSLSTSSTTLDMYAATFYSLVRLHVPVFPRACMGAGDATSDCIWVMLMDRYLNCSGLSRDHHAMYPPDDTEANARPEVVAANHMNATTRLTFLNLLLVLLPFMRVTTAEMQRRVEHYYSEMTLSSKLDAALPVRKASLELSIALEHL